jgi:hypothetical protein
MNRIRNYLAVSALLTSLVVGFALFTSCGPRPEPGTDPGTCAVEPGQDIAKTLGITVCGDAPDTVSYGQSGTVLLEVNPNLDGRYTLQLETCASYDFRACGLGTSGETECVELTTTPEQLVNDSYDADLPGGCDVAEDDDDTDPLDTPSVQERFADCMSFATANYDTATAVGDCCAAPEFENETDVGYTYGATPVNCVDINSAP